VVGDARPLRVAYFGTPEFAVPTLTALIASRHPVVVVVSQPDRPKGRGHQVVPTPTKRIAHAEGIPVLQPAKLKDEAFLEAVGASAPDIGVVAAYGRIIPDALLNLPRLGMINVHASVLPAYRGAAPIQRAVMAGETETGVTIMRVVSALDAGPMLDVSRVPIADTDTSVDVAQRLATLGAERLVVVLDRLAAGTADETPQDDARATYAPKITREDSRIDWARPARDIHNQVRGLQPWPMAAARLGGVRCLLHRTSVEPRTDAAAPGTILSAGKEGIVVAAGEDALCLLAFQPEGRRAMTAAEFLAGRTVEPGVTVGPA
jgi:methionyl-tRNA formyltransferase